MKRSPTRLSTGRIQEPPMLKDILQPEVAELIEAKDFAALKKALMEMEIHDLAELIGALEGEELAVCFRLLPWRLANDVFAELEVEQQEQVLSMLSSERVAGILQEMPPDDRTELLEELPDKLASRMLYSLRGQELEVAKKLLAYPEDSIGRLMTPEYVAVRPDWTVARVLEHLRKVGKDKETLNVLYVIDDSGRLLDDVNLERLILAEPSTEVEELMDRQVAALQVADDREQSIELVMKYDQVAMPVVTRHGVLVGIVTVDDILDVVEEEVTEDFQKMSAVGALESTYFRTSGVRMLAKRLPWLMLLFVAEVFTVVAIDAFQEGIDKALLVMMVGFVPLINACAGNTGSQMAGLMIRGLAVAEIDLADWHRVLARELLQGLVLGLVVAGMGLVTVLIFDKGVSLGIGVGLALVVVMTVANLLGAMLPFVFKKIGVDPAVTSGPFIASMMDISAIVIYFSIAMAVISMVG
jgi:magnesium transporter